MNQKVCTVKYGHNYWDYAQHATIKRPDGCNIHPNYYNDNTQWSADIAVCLLSEPIQMNQWSAWPICLPGSYGGAARAGEWCEFTGWGSETASSVTGKFTHNEWLKGYNTEIKSFDFDNSIQGDKIPCYGDGGGPLVCPRSGTAVLYGLALYFTGIDYCAPNGAEPQKTGGYANVYDYGSWIQTQAPGAQFY